MEHEHHHEERDGYEPSLLDEQEIEKTVKRKKINSDNAILWGSGIITASIILSTAIYVFAERRIIAPVGSDAVNSKVTTTNSSLQSGALDLLQEQVIPSGGVVLPVTWGNLGQQMVNAGVIDETQFETLYAQQGGLPQDMVQMLNGSNNGQIKMTPQNAGIILNMLWALGLGQNSAVLTAGPMMTNGQAQPGQFASTGGWTLAVGNAMDHYAKHDFFNLTPAQEQLVESVAKNIYRPCCGNSTYFPDCNHGMAMLGLLELMASQGATADQMYQAALTVNSYWFPDTYLTIAEYLQNKGIAWNTVKPEDILSATYSSAQGYQHILSQIQPVQSNQSGGNNCGS